MLQSIVRYFPPCIIATPPPASKKHTELTFDEDEDDLMDALGFSDAPKERGSGLLPKKEKCDVTFIS